jgi:hypothetical protein
MVTVVPPAVGPEVGEILVTVGTTVEGECVQPPATMASRRTPPTKPGTPFVTPPPRSSVLAVTTAPGPPQVPLKLDPADARGVDHGGRLYAKLLPSRQTHP